MTCDQFKILFNKATTGDATILSLTVAERTSLINHCHECEACLAIVKEGAAKEREEHQITEEEVVLVKIAARCLTHSDSLDPESNKGC